MKNLAFWKKGSGTFLEFSIVSLMMTCILIFIVHLFSTNSTIADIDLYSSQIARDVVVCSSMEEARAMAETEAEGFLSSVVENLVVTVSYYAGSEQEWKKGNYIVVDIEGYIKGYSQGERDYYQHYSLVMIEKGGVD